VQIKLQCYNIKNQLETTTKDSHMAAALKVKPRFTYILRHLRIRRLQRLCRHKQARRTTKPRSRTLTCAAIQPHVVTQSAIIKGLHLRDPCNCYYYRLIRHIRSTKHILYTHNERNIHYKNEKCKKTEI